MLQNCDREKGDRSRRKGEYIGISILGQERIPNFWENSEY
jgi:hypothetical protein